MQFKKRYDPLQKTSVCLNALFILGVGNLITTILAFGLAWQLSNIMGM